jgi:molybdate transport system permease protein
MDESILSALHLSLLIATLATAIVFVTGTAIGYLLATRSFRGKIILEVILLLPLVLPPTVVGYYLLRVLGSNGVIGKFIERLFGFSLLFTWQSAVIAATVVALPLMVKVAQSAIESVNRDLVETAWTLGHSECVTAFRVVLPLASKGIGAGAILAFARCLGEFGATLMVAGNIPERTATMPLTIYSLASAGEWDKANLLVILLTAISAASLVAVRLFDKKALSL